MPLANGENMGLIPTLLNMYARNKRYRQQRRSYEQEKAERQQQKAQQAALSTLQQQQNQMQRTFMQQDSPYDPFKTLNEYFPE